MNRLVHSVLMLLGLAAVSTPVLAERVDWDYSPHPGLAAVMTMGAEAPIFTRDRAPRFVLTRIVVRGQSPEAWEEVLDVLNTRRKDEPANPVEWFERYRRRGDSTCAGQWLEIERGKDSLTFERRIPACGADAAQVSFNRILYGEKQVFLLTAAIRGEAPPDLRAAWIAVLASAEVRP